MDDLFQSLKSIHTFPPLLDPPNAVPKRSTPKANSCYEVANWITLPGLYVG